MRCSAKKFSNFPKIHRVLLECYNTCATESLFNNVTGLGTPAQVFTCEFCENFQNTFSWKTFFMGDCLFLLHISGFQLVFMIKNFGWYFSSILYRNEKWPLEGVHLIKIPENYL